MSRRLAWRVVLLMTAALAAPEASAGGQRHRFPCSPCSPWPDLVVRIDDHAGVPPAVLSRAKAEVDVIFDAAGVRIKWEGQDESAETGQPAAMRLRLLVVKVESISGRSEHPIVGLAARPAGRAFVFFDRLLDVAANKPIDTGVVLGRIMAHELGHLLLPPGPHAQVGLMRSHIEMAAGSPDRFSAAEARQLRSAVMGGTAELTLSSSRGGR